MTQIITTILGIAALAGVVTFFALKPSHSGSVSAVINEQTVIIDVRTAAEYASGHLDGARLLDVSNGQLKSALPSLGKEVHYVVYCRSGNRSAQAVKLMQENGFTHVTNLGSVSEAATATKKSITTEG